MLLHEFSEIIVVDAGSEIASEAILQPVFACPYMDGWQNTRWMTNGEVSSLCKKVSTKYTIYISDVYVRIEKHARPGGSGGMLLHEIFRDHSSRCSEIAFEAILG